MEAIKIHNNISIKDNKQLINKKNWRRIRIFNKTYRLNPVAERRYKVAGDVVALVGGVISIMFLYVVLAI